MASTAGGVGSVRSSSGGGSGFFLGLGVSGGGGAVSRLGFGLGRDRFLAVSAASCAIFVGLTRCFGGGAGDGVPTWGMLTMDAVKTSGGGGRVGIMRGAKTMAISANTCPATE